MPARERNTCQIGRNSTDYSGTRILNLVWIHSTWWMLYLFICVAIPGYLRSGNIKKRGLTHHFQGWKLAWHVLYSWGSPSSITQLLSCKERPRPGYCSKSLEWVTQPVHSVCSDDRSQLLAQEHFSACGWRINTTLPKRDSWERAAWEEDMSTHFRWLKVVFSWQHINFYNSYRIPFNHPEVSSSFENSFVIGVHCYHKYYPPGKKRTPNCPDNIGWNPFLHQDYWNELYADSKRGPSYSSTWRPDLTRKVWILTISWKEWRE